MATRDKRGRVRGRKWSVLGAGGVCGLKITKLLSLIIRPDCVGVSLRMAQEPTRPVTLRLLVEIVSRYESGAEELKAEFELPEITAELLMHVCLAAPQVDDLVLGFVRDDLRVVSLGEQTRQMVQRDVGFLDRDRSRWMTGAGGALAAQLALKSRAEADARMAQGRSSELEEFILKNREVFDRVRAMKHSDLVRWVMLALMRETEARKRGSAVIAAWREKLGPEMRARVEAVRARLAVPEERNSPTVAPSGFRAARGTGVGGP